MLEVCVQGRKWHGHTCVCVNTHAASSPSSSPFLPLALSASYPPPPPPPRPPRPPPHHPPPIRRERGKRMGPRPAP
eukprot:7709304-Pyramimonas_sp.AAC.1